MARVADPASCHHCGPCLVAKAPECCWCGKEAPLPLARRRQGEGETDHIARAVLVVIGEIARRLEVIE